MSSTATEFALEPMTETEGPPADPKTSEPREETGDAPGQFFLREICDSGFQTSYK